MSRFSVFLVVAVAVCAVYAAKRRQTPAPLTAIAKIQGNGGVTGNVKFICDLEKGAVNVVGEIRGLAPGEHGFHIHQYGDTRDSCASMGGHYNPENHKHGAPSDTARHVGDLGNIRADDKGVAQINIWDSKITLKGEKTIVGRGVVVHANKDDLGKGNQKDSQTTGNAGGRVGCGIIAFAKS